MEITKNSNLFPFLNKKVRVITEINSVFIGKLYFVDGKKNFKLSNCREFITRFGVYRYNGFFKNVNFNGDKKMTIDFDFNYPPLVTENSTISSMVYSCQHPRKSYEKIQGKQSVAVLPRVTRESNAEPMFCNLAESRSSRRTAQGNFGFQPSESLLPDVATPLNAGSMFCDPTDLGNPRSELPEIHLRGATKMSNGKLEFYDSKTSNLQGNQSVEAPESSPKIKSKIRSMSCDLEKPSTSQRIIPGNQKIAPQESFPRHVRRSILCHSKAQRGFQGNRRIGPPKTVAHDVKAKLGNSEKITIVSEDRKVEYPEVSLHDVTNNMYQSNQGNQNVESQNVMDATKRMEALSIASNSEIPSTSQGSVQGNQNGIPFFINNHENSRLQGGEENTKLDEERAVIPYNLLPPAPQSLPVFQNIEEQIYGNQGSYNFSTHALICVPIFIKMEFRLSN